MDQIPSFSMVIGGASSGKSSFAEKLVTAAPGPNFYVATAQAFDDEMRLKINQHKEMRAGDNWLTVEAPIHIGEVLHEIPADGTALIDCATMWLTNVLLGDHDLEAAIAELLSTIAAAAPRIVVVTNEVGQGIVPDNALARQFRQAQGQLNARMAAQADLVVNVIAGLPMVLKGALPNAAT